MTTELSPEERQRLASVLGCTPDELGAVLTPFHDAASEEYIRMMLGQAPLTRVTEIRENRLYLLIKHAFNPRMPSEAQVSRIFQITPTQGRALLRNVLARYGYELQPQVKSVLRSTIERARPDQNVQGGYLITEPSRTIVDELNALIESIDGSLPPISRQSGSAISYTIAPSTYRALTDALQE